MAATRTRVAHLLLGIWMAGVLVAMFVVIPQYEGLGNAGRIIIMHVPTAWVSVLAFGVSATFSALYLWRKKPEDDDRALAAAECGFLFTVLATVTGAIFSQVVWGIYWNWDPRQTSIFVLLLIYAGLFALRAALDNPDQKRQLGAVFSLFAFVTVPFLIFVAPRMAESTLHPNCAFLPGSKCDGIELSEGRIGLLGDRKVQLLTLEQRGDQVVAQVIVSEPGLASEATLTPSFDVAKAAPAAMPEFPGLRYRIKVQNVDMATGVARLNIEAPGTGASDLRTRLTLLASTLGFTALFIWMYQIRARLLGIQWQLAQRQGAWQ